MLLHSRLTFTETEYETFRKFVKYTFDLGSVSIYELNAKNLYRTIQLHLQEQINGGELAYQAKIMLI